MSIKITKNNSTREIELLPSIKNPDAFHFKFGNEYAELTTDLSKTNAGKKLKFIEIATNKEYYIKEKFEFSSTYNTVNTGSQSPTDITHFFSEFSVNTKIKKISVAVAFNSPGNYESELTKNVPETGDFKLVCNYRGGYVNTFLIRKGGKVFVDWYRPGNNGRCYFKGHFTIEN